MAFTDSITLVVGNATKASEGNEIADNTEFLRDWTDVEHEMGISTADGTHKDINADSITSTGATVLDGGTFTYNTSEADLDFRVAATGATNALFVQGSDGNVGIGTASPLTNLHVSAADPIIRLQGSGSGDAALTRTMWGAELIGGAMNASSKYAPAIKFMSTDNAFSTENPKFLASIVGVATESYDADTDGGMGIAFATTPNTPGATSVPVVNMTLGQNGYLGMGITIATQNIHAREDVASALLTGKALAGDATGAFISVENRDASDDSGGGILYSGTGTNGLAAGIVFLDRASNATGTAGATTFWNAASVGANPTESMRITEDGNVGIGNTAPGRELEVSASAKDSEIEISTWSTTDDDVSDLVFQKSASATINTLAATAAGEDLGRIFGIGVHTGSAIAIATQILFEGDASPDADAVPGRILFSTSDATTLKESFRVDDEQNVLIANNNGLVIGALAQQSIGSTLSELQVLGTSYADSSIALGRWAADSNPAFVNLYKSRDTTIGSNTAVTTGDDLGGIAAYGDDGTDEDTRSSQITFDTEGTIGTGRVPGVITFSTLTDEASPTLTEAMRINSSQYVGIGTTTPQHILTVDSGSTATTTVQFGDHYDGTGHTCFEGSNSSGNVFSFYFSANNVMQVEDKECVE